MSGGHRPPLPYAFAAESHEEAKERYEIHKSFDPFPHIKPTLLNSADIEDYTIQTGMIHPFEPRKSLKPASYEVPFNGFCRFWDDSGKVCEQTIHANDSFRLRANSIVFVQPDTVFRLPGYIAIRFNLQITHVHRGILLGTGPLVDPGFSGRLLIPLHNLTTNDYYFRGGEGLIWIEFTKVSPNPRWHSACERAIGQKGTFEEFPSEKTNRDADDYLVRAAPGQAIRSSVGDFVQKAKGAELKAEEARNQVNRITAAVATFGGFGVLLAVITLASSIGILYFALHDFVDEFMTQTNDRLDRLERSLEDR